MQLHPTRSTFHVALAGAAMIAVGVAARVPAVVAFGGAMVLAVAAGRAVALLSVTRLRSSGFEMVWVSSKRVVRTTRGGEVKLEAELRNRASDDVRGVQLRAVASSMLSARIEPDTIDIPAGGRVRVDVIVQAKRVGRWGLHGVALEVRGTPGGGEGLYEVPLMFANPFGIEVLPRALHSLGESPRGGRARRAAFTGRASNVSGEGDEFRELREHVPGDPFKRIAWKASARRGQLVVRELEREERDIIWLVVDASVELWAGDFGRAPLDLVVDEVAAVAARHLARGDLVGLAVVASRLRTWIEPEGGAAHAAKLAGALSSAASLADADRSELDEYEVAQRVAEHARPLDPHGLSDVPRGDLDRLAARAEALRARAPFAARKPYARTPREERLRHYLASFGIELPPRLDGEREKTNACLATTLEKLATDKPRPSVVHVWSVAPTDAANAIGVAAASPSPLTSPLARAIRIVKGRRIDVRWTLPPLEVSFGRNEADAAVAGATQSSLGRSGETQLTLKGAVEDAVQIRARAARRRGERVLRRMGIRPLAVAHLRSVAAAASIASTTGTGGAGTKSDSP